MRRLSGPLLGVLMLAACTAASGDPSATDGEPPGGGDSDPVLVVQDGATATGPGITVSAAIVNGGGAEPVLVNGALFIDSEGGVLLCEAIAESFPPQCGGARLRVEGLDLSGDLMLQEANGVRWAESVQILGTVRAEG